MIKIQIRQYLGRGPDSVTFQIEVPALPRQGDHMSSDIQGFNGYVDRTSFYWDEDEELTIEVLLK